MLASGPVLNQHKAGYELPNCHMSHKPVLKVCITMTIDCHANTHAPPPELQWNIKLPRLAHTPGQPESSDAICNFLWASAI